MRKPLEIRKKRYPVLLRRVGAGIVGAGAIAAVAITAWAGYSEQSARTADVMLLYVGADDCPPCRAWQKGDGALFFTSAEYARVTFNMVKSPHLTDVLDDQYWPEDIRSYRDRLKRGDGVPMWLVVANGQIVEQRFGEAEWRSSILPKIRSFMR